MTANSSLTITQQKRLLPLKGKKILILGAGREGLSTFKFLRQVFPKQVLTVADRVPLRDLNPAWKEIFDLDPHLVGIFGDHYLNSLAQFDFLFKTPGIPSTSPLIQAALAQGVQLTSNVEWFFRLARGQTIGVTGTKGKSTTSSLIAHVFQTAGFPTLLIGNIGFPSLNYLFQTTSKTISVLELSSHQLQDLHHSPHFAVIQNITSEHLDYYQNTDAYVQAKTPIVRFQKSTDFLIYSDEFPTCRDFAALTPATKLCFGLKPAPGHLASIQGRAVLYNDGKRAESVLNLRKIKLLGKHNQYNLLPALILAKHFLISNEQIETAFYSFTPLRHRLEYVETIKHVSYYNDSLSTTPEATVAALKTFPHSNLHLLAGGHERHQNYAKLAAAILKYPVKTLLLFPTTGHRLKKAVINLALKKTLLVPDFIEVSTMTEAVKAAAAVASPHDIVLLSPAAASFGNFKDYADRGDQFCAAVRNLV